MEPSTSNDRSFLQPKPLSELLPLLRGISRETIQSLTATKKSRPTMGTTLTTLKVVKPLTIEQMKADFKALKLVPPQRCTQAPASSKKRGWNSSVKIDKTVSHTANGQLKNNPVRKVLNFQAAKPKVVTNSRMTMLTTETPKIPKSQSKLKNSIRQQQAKSNVRISGICIIPPTPVETSKPIKNRMTMANKENNPYRANISRKLLPPPTPVLPDKKTEKLLPPTPILPENKTEKLLLPPTPILPDNKTRGPKTPLTNSSWRTGSDSSFLQKEKEIEEKIQGIIAEESMLENIAEVSPPVSTPFKEYRSVQEFFNNSSAVENSALYADNTIMCFDKPSVTNNNDNREESVIMTLCDLLNKATVANCESKENTEIDGLLEVEKQIVNNIDMLENGIQMLANIKEAQIKSLQNVKRLIAETGSGRISESDGDKTLVETKTPKVQVTSAEISPIISRPCSVIKSVCSPTYKIPKKNGCLRKNVCKSIPNLSNAITPVKDIEGRALTVYMEMKQQMNFLTTPKVNHGMEIPDTPAVTSHNLQKQLDKLFNGS